MRSEFWNFFCDSELGKAFFFKRNILNDKTSGVVKVSYWCTRSRILTPLGWICGFVRMSQIRIMGLSSSCPPSICACWHIIPWTVGLGLFHIPEEAIHRFLIYIFHVSFVLWLHEKYYLFNCRLSRNLISRVTMGLVKPFFWRTLNKVSLKVKLLFGTH